MPTSCPTFRSDILNYIRVLFPSPETTILDLGTGEGTYSHLLRPYYPNIDGVEVWEPYVKKYGLNLIYRHLFIGDVREFEFRYYDIIIAGDVLEHLSVVDAQSVVEKAKKNCSMMIVAIPYRLPQDSWNGNSYEAHMQDDLTHELFMERYPGFIRILSLQWTDIAGYGIYVYSLSSSTDKKSFSMSHSITS